MATSEAAVPVLYGRTNSANVQKVMWAFAELGVEYQRVDAGKPFPLNGSNPEYLKINPHGLVPALVDGNVHLWESNAIVRYIDAKYGSFALSSTDPLQRAQSDMWTDWQLTNADFAMANKLFRDLIRSAGAAPEGARERAISAFQKIEAHLEHGKKFIAGDTVTLGDIAIGPFLHRFLNIPIERPELPNVQRYYAALCERPAYKEHVAVLPLT